jgi:hypothetical protein
MRATLLAAVIGAGSLVVGSAPALAQRDVSCRETETQPECHKRLKCKADEDLEACQNRLSEAAEGGREGDRGGRDDEGGGGDRDRDRGHDDEGGGDRGGRDDDGGHYDDEGGGGRGERGEGRRGRGEGRRRGGDGGPGYAANKTFGLGLELGEPTGLNGKVFVADRVAIDFGLGWIYRHYYYDDGVHIYADVLWHPVSLVSSPAFELPFYVGLGLRYWDFEYCHQGVCGYDADVIGFRIPFGIAFDFNSVPLDIFFQLVPTIDFVDEDYVDRRGDDDVHAGIDASVGFRYWFF